MQFSLRMLLTAVLFSALLFWAVRERAARKGAENRARVAVAEADQARQLADVLNTMSIALDGERMYVWDTDKGSLMAISRSTWQILWEHLVDLQRYPEMATVSPPQVEGNVVYLVDVEGNRSMTIDARSGELTRIDSK